MILGHSLYPLIMEKIKLTVSNRQSNYHDQHQNAQYNNKNNINNHLNVSEFSASQQNNKHIQQQQ